MQPGLSSPAGGGTAHNGVRKHSRTPQGAPSKEHERTRKMIIGLLIAIAMG